MRLWGTRSARGTDAAVALVAIATLALGGCVTRGTYDEVVVERDRLATNKRQLDERVRMLEASAESLQAERVALIDEMEDLRRDREQLDREVRQLEKSRAELSQNLSQREAQLAEVQKLRETYEGLVSDLEAEVAAGQIAIEQLREGLRLDLQEDVLFPSGSSDVNSKGRSVLARVATRLKELPHTVEVQGHTDNVPIRTPRFPSNWELAGARASGVVRLLAAGGVDPGRLRAVSLGEYRPAVSNATPQGRARNRRIEITLEPVPAAAAAGEDSSAAPAASSAHAAR
jgi:chemotaxis protein MotB